MELSELSDRGEDEGVKCPDAQGIQARVGILDFLLNVVKTHRRALSRTVQELLFNSQNRWCLFRGVLWLLWREHTEWGVWEGGRSGLAQGGGHGDGGSRMECIF